MKEWIKVNKIYLIVGFFLLASAGYYYFFIPEGLDQESFSSEGQSMQKEEWNQEGYEVSGNIESHPQDINESMMADIKGAVKAPGVYEIKNGERVIDLVERAGGLTEDANHSDVNFAMYVEDEMVIYIPRKGEGEVEGSAFVGSVQGIDQTKININKAGVEDLDELPGIGPSKAETIVEYRETNGPFKTIEDIKLISGIGDKTYEKLKDLISVK